MTTPPPSEGVTTAEAVAAQLQWSDPDRADPAKLETLTVTVAAVNEVVAAHARTGPHSRALGATMLAARLWRRRNSAEGVATFGQDGPVYVQRHDPDVAMLLGLGTHAPPVVG